MTPTQFTAKTRNLAKQNNLNPQLVQRHFMMDHFVEAIAESEYRTIDCHFKKWIPVLQSFILWVKEF